MIKENKEKRYKMKILHSVLGVFVGVSMLVFLLITAFEIGAYSDFGWYEKAYQKYDVMTDLQMEMKDVMDVTEEMMAYLRGNRSDLDVETVVDGVEREFFNDREKAHMEDVQKLFIGGLWIRRGAGVLLVFAAVLLIITKAKWQKLIPQSILISMGSFIGVTLAAGVLFMSDFTKYFTIFHEIFFDNDLWLLDPSTDLLIRMLPEGFFLDMVLRIGMAFLVMMFLTLIISIMMLMWSKIRKTNKTIKIY